MRDRLGVAVVTGASAGVGRATAVALARKGYDVGLLARGSAGMIGAAEEIAALGRRAVAIRTDVARHEEVRGARERIESELGPVDMWINNAMTTVFARTVGIAPDDFARAVEVTFLGQVWGTLVALETMRARNEGTIVNVGSALAFVGIPLQAPYCAAKFACRGFFQSVRAELLEEGSGVRLAMVHLPAVNTPQFDWCATDLARQPKPVPPVYQPERVAEAIVDVALHPRRSRVFGAWNRLVVAAVSVAPGLGTRYAALSGSESQLAPEPIAPGHASNLHTPVDDHHDHGSRGRFSAHALGTADPSFLRSLPHTLGLLARAARDAASGDRGDGRRSSG